MRDVDFRYAPGVACVLVLWLFGCVCSPGSSVDPKAVAIWQRHESVFRDALQGHQKNDEFDKACLFFEETTGLTLHLNNFTFGVLPTPDTDQDLARIQAWFNANKSRLYWDEKTRTVKVHPLH